MAKPKEERNRLFIEDWQRGLSNEDLAKKYGLSAGETKALKQRLRAKDPSLYTGQAKKKIRESSSQVTSPSTSTTTQTSTSTKRMTFWLEEEMIEKIKTRAREERRTSSDVMRQMLKKNL